ncbi:MAG: ABC transporter permease [Planctomycetota bacterium]|nr:ABC transporter permease [Planctomycetota bacterium]MDA0933641.1 ABC transporter permease [Planctomycetota bacterium]
MYRYFLALRYLLARPINLLGVVGIMLGVWALIVVVSIFSGFLKEVARHLQSSTADMTAINLPEGVPFDEIRAIVEADPNVAACSPRIVWQGLVHPFGDQVGRAAPPAGMSELGAATPFVSVLGIDPDLERGVTRFRDWLDVLDDPTLRVADLDAPLAMRDGLPGLVLSRQRMAEDGVVAGDRAKLTVGRMRREGGREELDFRPLACTVAGAYETSYAGFDGMNVFVHIDTMRGFLDGDARSESANEVAIRLHDTAEAANTAARLQRALAEGVAGRGASWIRVRTWAEANAGRIGNVEHQRSLMKLVLFVIMVVAAFLMYATLSMMVTEKTHDIGILTAMGASPRGVMAVFTGCGVAIAVVGAGLGVAFGCLSSIYLDSLNKFLTANFGIDLFPVRIYHLRHVPYDLDPVWISQVAGSALVVGALVAAIPAWRAARYDPLDSLRNE